MLSMIFALGLSCADAPSIGALYHRGEPDNIRPCANSLNIEKQKDLWSLEYSEFVRMGSDTIPPVYPEALDDVIGRRTNYFLSGHENGNKFGLTPSIGDGYRFGDKPRQIPYFPPEKNIYKNDGSGERNLSLILALGWSCVDDHGNGVWYQDGFSHTVKLCAKSWEIGKRVGAWTFGYTRLVRTWSDAIALGNDADYDITNKRCRSHCDQTVRVITAGRVDGVYLRREWLHGPLVLEGGVLFFRPEHTVYLSDFGARNDAGVQYLKDLRIMHQNKPEYKIAPSFGAGYRLENLTLMFRYYLAVRSSGDRCDSTGHCKSLTSLYSGSVFQTMIQYEFK